MKLIITFFLLTIITLACEQPSPKHENNYQSVEIIKTEAVELEDNKKAAEPTNETIRGKLTIEYPFFDFTISHSTLYADGLINQKNNDTTIIYLDLGEYLDSASIEVHHDGTHTVDIYQMYQNSITIMNEGPHCDLVNWKHYNSEWIAIKKYNDYDFIAESYTNGEWENFIDIDIRELQNAVLEHCGDEWAKHVADINAANEYPSSVGMNRILFKIEMTHPTSQIKTQQIIAFEIPMGC